MVFGENTTDIPLSTRILQRIGKWKLAGASLVIFVVYYLLKIAKKPVLTYQDNSKNRALVKACPALQETYYPPIWAYNTHLSTPVGAYLRSSPPVNYVREIIKAEDEEGSIHLDWETSAGDEPDRPTIIVLTGLNGGSRSSYVASFIYYAAQHGWRCVAMFHRGASGTPLTSARTYCGACTKDVSRTIQHVTSKYPNAPVTAIGWSLGSNILCKYVGQSGENTPLLAAASISNPFDFKKTSGVLARNWVYNYVLCAGLVKMVTHHKEILGKIEGIDFDAVLKSKRLHDFDNLFTCKLFGYPTLEDYYADASCVQYLDGAKIPLIMINAIDDPIVDETSIPYPEAKRNPNTMLVTTERGGHCGFPTGQFPIGRYKNMADHMILQYFYAVLTDPASKAKLRHPK